MCGILFINVYSDKIKHISKNDFTYFTSLLSYRGPDSLNTFIDGNIYLGHVRLSIVGLSSDFNQPYGSDYERFKLLFNGEIYNYNKLDLAALSDTQLLHKLIESRKSFTELARGMYSIIIYDKLLKQINIFRDFFGEKPLYYYSDADIFIASSTINSIKAVLQFLDKKISLNLDYLISDYLLFGFIREPHTVYNEILTLPAGHSLRLNDGVFTIEKIDFALEAVKPSDLDYPKNAFSSTDVKKNLLVSSGIDSAMLLHLAKLDGDINTEAIIYKSANKFSDESSIAKEHVKKILEKDPIIVNDFVAQKDILPAFVKILEQPSSDGLNLFNLLTSLKEKDKSVRLIYTGLGGDEMYGGYNSFKYWRVINFLITIPFINFLIPSLERFILGKKILQRWDPYVYYFLYRLDFNLYKELNDNGNILHRSFKSFVDTISPYKDLIKPHLATDLMKIKVCESFDYMKNQLLRDNDNISMHFSIESRSPLLDPDVFFVKPDSRKWMKKLLKEAYEILFTKKKGFTYDYFNNENITDYNYLSTVLNLNLKKRDKKIEILNEWLKNNINNNDQD